MQEKVRYHGILGDCQWYRYKKSYHQSHKPRPVGQYARVDFTATVSMCYGLEIILYELQTYAAL